MPARTDWTDERYVSTDVLAAMLGVSVRTLWRRIADGVLPPPTVRGKPHYFAVDALLRHIERVDPWLSCQLAGGIGRRNG